MKYRVRQFMRKNAEMLKEIPEIRALILNTAKIGKDTE